MAAHFWRIKKISHAALKTFKELKLINKRAKPVFTKDYKTKTVDVGLTRVSEYEKNIFHASLAEVFGPIDNPKYLLVKTRNAKKDYRVSYAVPEAFSAKKANAEVFKDKMTRRVDDFELYFTRSAEGKKDLAAAKKKARVNRNFAELSAKMKLKTN